MSYKIKNLTYSPLRIIINNVNIRLTSRGITILKEINDDLLDLEKKKLIKIRIIK